jgi:hypothetical protein
MKMLIISDAEGSIVATAHTQPQKDAPVAVGVIPEPGQTLHEVDVPDKLSKPESVLELHRDYRLEVALGEAKLVKTREAKS